MKLIARTAADHGTCLEFVVVLVRVTAAMEAIKCIVGYIHLLIWSVRSTRKATETHVDLEKKEIILMIYKMYDQL